MVNDWPLHYSGGASPMSPNLGEAMEENIGWQVLAADGTVLASGPLVLMEAVGDSGVEG